MSLSFPVETYLTRLRRRAAALHGLRAAVATAGAAGVVFASGALALGPLGEPALALLAWALVAAAAFAVLTWAWRAFVPWRGAGAARLLGEIAPELPSAARSAYELGRAPAGHASAEMIRAHEVRVRSVLARFPPRAVVRWRWLRHRSVGLGLVGIALAGMLLTTERGSAGAYALIHPGARSQGGDRVAVAFSGVEAHLVYPSYLDRPSTTLLDPALIEVPRGTSVELRASARIEAAAAALRVADRVVPMERDASGRFIGRFVAREDGPLVLRLRRASGEWVHDAADRSVRALADEAPRVTMVDPPEDLVLDRADTLDVRWDASDDVGVAHVDFVLRTPSGEETRRRVAFYPEGARPSACAGTAPLDLALLELRPGDSLTLLIEARDADIVSGPNLGRSSEVRITLASEATRRDQRLGELEAVLEAGLFALADRLERAVPEDPQSSGRRFESVKASTGAFVTAVETHAEGLREEREGRASDLALYAQMAVRVERLLRTERLAYARTLAPLEERRAIDARLVTELEDDVLALDDLLGRARVEDAAAIARELEALRREIHSLLSELARTDSAEARERLLAAIARAQARMRELAQRIAAMGTSVPQEFMNAGEMPTSESADTLAELREAVQRGNLELADRLLGELSRQIDRLARALGQTEASFVESRFGPRERALAEAMDALGGLEAEQGQLARRGGERRSRAAQRAEQSLDGREDRVARRLADQTSAVRSALEGLDRDGLAGFEQDAYDRARQRLVDAEDALRTGDLGEARRMAEAGAQDMSALSRELDLSALMFPGHEGETSRDARQARQADRQLRDLRRALDESLPDVSAHLDARERGQMREDEGRQRQARDASQRLAGQFEQGPDEAPLDEDAGRELRQAADEMRQAGEALARGDALDSARLQEESARRLTELRERLEQDSQGGGGGGSDSGESPPDLRRLVEIPDADRFEGPMEMRRRLLDAMREAPPRGYEDAVRRYYEGLLR